VNQDERASQLSAMFDGELPAVECELLSRRLARDEQLRATWSRYSVIGAALRAEPLAQVRPDFAHRVSAALSAGAHRRIGARERAPRPACLRSAALGSAVAAGVAGVADHDVAQRPAGAG
jgi:sigma-E factor negative regulatory protein RseA